MEYMAKVGWIGDKRYTKGLPSQSSCMMCAEQGEIRIAYRYRAKERSGSAKKHHSIKERSAHIFPSRTLSANR